MNFGKAELILNFLFAGIAALTIEILAKMKTKEYSEAASWIVMLSYQRTEQSVTVLKQDSRNRYKHVSTIFTEISHHS
jgi:hypothetical protein